MKTLFALVIGISLAAGCGPSTGGVDMCTQTEPIGGNACVPGCSIMGQTPCTCDATTSKWVCNTVHEPDGGTK